jgi:hypothetical protein
MTMARAVKANVGSVVRAGEAYHGKQGLDYTPGVSAQSVGSQAIWLGSDGRAAGASGDSPSRRLHLHSGRCATRGGQSYGDAGGFHRGADGPERAGERADAAGPGGKGALEP